ncbi:acetoin dehydrogenase dihydrolipoyllysine-residue acetyltransferase subunit [Acidiphilium sp.]|uniref:acetoin dehydrogenase dihydrolipoyllysine-residue acetyltransferase subunit n=1 Tax=Acidiphilium sp. TaxID=527 RepID=UPI003D0621D1
MAGIIPLTMPKFGLAMTEGKIASWTVPEGAKIEVGQEIADIETTKITNGYESPVKGILRRRVAAEQQDLPVGALIAIVADASVSDSDIDGFIAEFEAEFAINHTQERTEPASEPVIIEVDGCAIRYLETGREHDGPPIVLIHGFGGDLNNWMFNQTGLAEDYRVIALDLPGHGGSSKNVGAGDLETLSNLIIRLLAALEIPKAHLVGHSLGGAVALRMALDSPGRVASLSLISPTSLGEEIDAGFIAGFIEAGRRKQMQAILEKLFWNKSLVSRDMTDDVLKYKRIDGVTIALSTIATANFTNGRQKEILRGRLAGLSGFPVQIIWGDGDEILPVSHAQNLPAGISIHIIHDVGHMPQMEKATEVNRLISDMVVTSNART